MDEHAEVEPVELVLKFRGGDGEINAADGYLSIAQFDDATYGLHLQAGSAGIAAYLTRAQLAEHIGNLQLALANFTPYMESVREWNASHPEQAAVIVEEGEHISLGLGDPA